MLLILVSHGYSTIEPLSNPFKDKDKDKNKNDSSGGDTTDPVCYENQENIDNLRTQLDELSTLRTQMDLLSTTINSNDQKINMLVQKVQTIV